MTIKNLTMLCTMVTLLFKCGWATVQLLHHVGGLQVKSMICADLWFPFCLCQ